MNVSRRAIIRIVGGGVVVAAVTGAGLATCDTMPAEAIAGWRGPDGETEPRRRALAFALLAPNPHNMQSWIADLGQDGRIALYVDPARLLPATDPQMRQILVGCGCFLETLVLAAAAEGWRAEVAILPDGFDEAAPGARPFAVIDFARAEPSDALGLAAAILQRRSARVVYDGRPLAPDHEQALHDAHRPQDGRLAIVSDPQTVARLRALGMEAMRIEIDTDRTYLETVEVMRIGADQIAAHRDGLAFHGPFFWWARRLGLLSRESQMAHGSIARDTARAILDDHAASTASFAFIATRGNARPDQIAAGRAYVRTNLAATAAGVALAPWSQALQEFPEMAGLYDEIHALLAAPGETLQMFFRLGYAAPPPPTPRRALDAILRA